ncbi:MAG: DUF2752 domain-containing protein [Phototrophicaceae bacterium]
MRLLNIPAVKWAALLLTLGVVSLTWLIEIDTHQHAENGCPVYQMSGVPCPGCGITRGIFLIMNGHMLEGIMMNPFSIVLIIMTLALIGNLIYDIVKSETRTGDYLNWLANTGQRFIWILIPLVLATGIGADVPRRFAWRAVPAYAVALLLALFVMRDVYQRYQFVAYENPALTATRDVYNQQMQMARFLVAHYDNAVVAANDIGAINYFTDIDNVDLWGLGSIDVARAITENRYHTDAIRQLTSERATQIAIVYESWFEQYGGLPPEWVAVGRWQVAHDPAILGGDTVTFFAVDPAAADSLAANLRAFSASLPPGVIESGIYVDGAG